MLSLLQEQHKQIEAQEAKIQTLESDIAILKAEMEELRCLVLSTGQ
jgi:cell division protein FtsB